MILYAHLQSGEGAPSTCFMQLTAGEAAASGPLITMHLCHAATARCATVIPKNYLAKEIFRKLSQLEKLHSFPPSHQLNINRNSPVLRGLLEQGVITTISTFHQQETYSRTHQAVTGTAAQRAPRWWWKLVGVRDRNSFLSSSILLQIKKCLLLEPQGSRKILTLSSLEYRNCSLYGHSLHSTGCTHYWTE